MRNASCDHNTTSHHYEERRTYPHVIFTVTACDACETVLKKVPQSVPERGPTPSINVEEMELWVAEQKRRMPGEGW